MCSTTTGNQCINVNATDENNCGACNYKCLDHVPQHASLRSGKNQQCSSGKCQFDCDENYTCKGSGCSNDGLKCEGPNCFCECSGCNVNGTCMGLNEMQNAHMHANASKLCQCDVGYYLNGNECVSYDKDNCGAQGKQCQGNTPVCKIDEGKCVECLVADDCNKNGKGICQANNKCYYTECNNNYTPSENHDSCVPTKTRCGTSATDCTKIPNVLNADSVSCDNGFCVVTSCKPDSNTHVYNPSNGHGQCEANSKDHCGSHDYKCNDANATNISCQNGFCKIEDCNGDYHVCTQKEGVNNGHDICHKNETNECGKSHENCSSFFKDPQCINGVCSGSSCIGEKDGYTKCEKGNEALCLKKEGSWTGNSWPDDCSNCVGASNCSNGKSCKRSWTYGYSYSCE